jgi:hypothetical protein
LISVDLDDPIVELIRNQDVAPRVETPLGGLGAGCGECRLTETDCRDGERSGRRA